MCAHHTKHAQIPLLTHELCSIYSTKQTLVHITHIQYIKYMIYAHSQHKRTVLKTTHIIPHINCAQNNNTSHIINVRRIWAGQTPKCCSSSTATSRSFCSCLRQKVSACVCMHRVCVCFVLSVRVFVLCVCVLSVVLRVRVCVRMDVSVCVCIHCVCARVCMDASVLQG